MKNPRIEHLTPERIEALWPEIEKLVTQVSNIGGIVHAPVTPEYIYITSRAKVSHILGFFDDDTLMMVLVFELASSKNGRIASILALSGKNLMKFKALFWQDILAWFKEAGAVAVDAGADPRLANIYMRKFGFTDICSYVSMRL